MMKSKPNQWDKHNYDSAYKKNGKSNCDTNNNKIDKDANVCDTPSDESHLLLVSKNKICFKKSIFLNKMCFFISNI